MKKQMKNELREGERMTVYEAFCRMANWLKIGPRGECCLDIYKDGRAWFGQQWRLAFAIKNKTTTISFKDQVEYLGCNAFVVVE